MGVARGLCLALAGATILVVASVLPWESPDRDHGWPAREGSIAPAVGTGADAAPAASPVAAGPAAASQLGGAAPAPEVVRLAPRGALGSPRGQGLPASDRLPSALQRELARVGCYHGEINGVWTPAARQALKAFMDRVNAVLPTDTPDPVQLALVGAARERVCGVACPAGETFTDGRCLPTAILGRKPVPIATPGPPQADHGPGSGAWPLPQGQPALSAEASRMGLAGPTADRGSGPANPSATAAGIAPAQAPVAPGIARAEAKRPRPQPGLFGIFKAFEKLGF
jgi:hypothetical protein